MPFESPHLPIAIAGYLFLHLAAIAIYHFANCDQDLGISRFHFAANFLASPFFLRFASISTHIATPRIRYDSFRNFSLNWTWSLPSVKYCNLNK